jgi:hypothetical protein
MKDTYFLSLEEALKVAKERHNVVNEEYDKTAVSQDVQICYYNGEHIENLPDNLIALPIEKLYEVLPESRLRLPKEINFDGIEVNEEDRAHIQQYFDNVMSNVKLKLKGYEEGFKEMIEENSLSKTEPTRFLIICNHYYKPARQIAKKFYKTLEKMGFKVKLEMPQNELEGLHKAWYYRACALINPHIIIDIDSFVELDFDSKIKRYFFPMSLKKQEFSENEEIFVFSKQCKKEANVKKRYENIVLLNSYEEFAQCAKKEQDKKIKKIIKEKDFFGIVQDLLTDFMSNSK